MSYFLAFLGFVMLVILHEAGHFAAAKAVGMRVERFALFFPPLLFRKKIGETEYAIGAIPAGGYVKITGMNPSEELSDEVRTRAYYAQPPWKRIVVIAAGPLVNFVIALVLLFVYFWAIGPHDAAVGNIAKGFPAQGVLHPGDKIVAVDGHDTGNPGRIAKLLALHRCAQQPPRDRCRATTPATIVALRAHRRVVVKIAPAYDAKVKRMRLGFAFTDAKSRTAEPVGQAGRDATSYFWYVSKLTVALPLRVFNAQERKQIGSAVGAYEVTRQKINSDAGEAVRIIGLISLSLAIINLFPFLPLDGGHIFWAVLEKIRRKPVAFSVMERASFVGFALVLGFFFIGLSNDIGRLTGGGFGPR